MRIVPVHSLKPGMVLGRTIVGNQGQILLRQGVLLTDGYISFLKRYPLQAVYVSTGRDVEVADVVSDETRLKAVQATRAVLSQVKQGAELQIEKLNEVLVTVIDELLHQDSIMINLVDLRAFNEDLFSHGVNAAILSVLLGIECGLGRDELGLVAQAALLHDVGYLLVSEERASLHVEMGVERLRKSGISQDVLEPIAHHHERWDGVGYPNQLKGNAINELARIIQITNVFDRLSANNRYPLEEVIEYLMANSGQEFEPRAVRQFINCVSFYPVGTEVELNTGERGFVIKANKGFPTRPVIRIEKNMYGNTVEPGYSVDLVRKTTYFVKRKLGNISD